LVISCKIVALPKYRTTINTLTSYLKNLFKALDFFCLSGYTIIEKDQNTWGQVVERLKTLRSEKAFMVSS